MRLLRSSEDDGIRTRNFRIDSPRTSYCNSHSESTLRQPMTAGRSAGRSEERGEGGFSDPELARLADVWEHLPEHIRRTILVIADAATT